MKRLLIALTLITVLSATAFGGDMPTGGVAPPPGSGMTQTTVITEPGDIPTGGLAVQLADQALSAALAVLSLLS